MISVVLDVLDCWVLKCNNFDNFGRVFDECALAQSYKACLRAREGHVVCGISKLVVNFRGQNVAMLITVVIDDLARVVVVHNVLVWWQALASGKVSIHNFA